MVREDIPTKQSPAGDVDYFVCEDIQQPCPNGFGGKREFGISLVYITHDLTTAYQISQNIYVIYRGSVAEMGSVDEVIRQPKHPYTHLLVSSVPLPDPAQRDAGARH